MRLIDCPSQATASGRIGASDLSDLNLSSAV